LLWLLAFHATRGDGCAEIVGQVMKAKHQRLILALVAVLALIGAGLLAASALRDEAAYFYAPADVRAKGFQAGKAIRLGGMVVKGSLTRAADGVTIHFEVTDGKATVPAVFKGIAPDLFKEGSGVVAEGAFDSMGTFVATNLLAKHDERYMPRELEGLRYDEKTREMKAER
jgi:cytochrome c-type biogenesis protein CcmE